MKWLYLLVLLALPAAANAQSGTLMGEDAPITRIPGPDAAEIPTSSRLSQEDVARVVTLRFARCMLQRSRRTVVPALISPQFAPSPKGPVPVLASTDCLAAGELKMPSHILRGAYFTVLYRDRYRGGLPSLTPAVENAFYDGAATPFSEKQQQWIALRQFADCVARRDVRAAHAAVVSEPGSKAEAAAFTALKPHLNACLQSGVSLKFNRATLSGLLAEVMYRQSGSRP